MLTSGKKSAGTSKAAADILDIGAILDAAAKGGIAMAPARGRRARRRAMNAQLAKAGLVAPLLAAEGCLAVGKEGLPLAAGHANGGNSGNSGGNNGSAAATSSSSDGPIIAGNDIVSAAVDEGLQIDTAQLLENDVANSGQALEVVRVFGAVNGTVVLDGAIVQFTPDAGYEGLATFQYEVRDADGNTTSAVVEVNVGEMSQEGMNMNEGDGMPAHGVDSELMPEHMAVMNLVPVAEATHIAVNNGSWFDPNTWAGGEIPGEGAKVHIPEGVSVEYDGESPASIFTIRVDGELNFATDQNTFMEVDTFIVTRTGHLTIGTIDNPVQAGVEAVVQIADNGPIDTAWDPMLFSRGLISHGSIQVHGAEKDSFLRLAEDPMQGDTSILLEEIPDGWNAGDRLVLTGTHLGTVEGGFTHGAQRTVTTEDEELTIARIEGNRVYFSEPLAYDHDAPRDDLKAYVANYTRNVRVITENADEIPVYQRGHVMLMHSDDIDVRYGEFTDLGRTDKSQRSFDVAELDTVNYDTNIKARYSLHIHRSGVDHPEDPAYLVGNAVWGSPGWGYVHHDSNAILADNAAYDVFGAAFVAETGNETGRWTHNISIKNGGVAGLGTPLNNPKDADDVNAFDLGRNGTGFWFQGRLVAADDNVAAGSPGGHGFTYFHRGTGQIDVSAGSFNRDEILNYGSVDSDDVNVPSIIQFSNNEAFAVGTGLIVVKANGNQFNDNRSVIDEFTAWDVAVGALIEYSRHYTLNNFDVISADLEGVSNYAGIIIGKFARDIVINGATIDGFRIGVDLHENHIDDGPDSELFFIDVNIFNQPHFSDLAAPTEAYLGLSGADTILTAAEFETLNVNQSLSFDSDFAEFSALVDDFASKDNLSGVKHDSLGDYAIGSTDPHYFDLGAYRVAVVDEGYWTLPDGRAVTSFERYFTDRITGEQIKIATFVEVPGGVSEARDLGGLYHGVLDQDSLAPVGVNDAASVQENGSVLIDVLGNDSDPDGDPIALDGLGEARHGSVYANDDGTVTYVPDPNYSGEDEFHYWVEDDNGNFSQALVTVTVEA